MGRIQSGIITRLRKQHVLEFRPVRVPKECSPSAAVWVPRSPGWPLNVDCPSRHEGRPHNPLLISSFDCRILQRASGDIRLLTRGPTSGNDKRTTASASHAAQKTQKPHPRFPSLITQYKGKITPEMRYQGPASQTRPPAFRSLLSRAGERRTYGCTWSALVRGDMGMRGRPVTWLGVRKL